MNGIKNTFTALGEGANHVAELEIYFCYSPSCWRCFIFVWCREHLVLMTSDDFTFIQGRGYGVCFSLVCFLFAFFNAVCHPSHPLKKLVSSGSLDVIQGHLSVMERGPISIPHTYQRDAY
ncbi:hypothetical protein BBOR36S_02411 [Brevibacillus borstelensis]